MTENCTMTDTQGHRLYAAPRPWAAQARHAIAALFATIAWARRAQRLLKSADRDLTGQAAPRDQLAQRVLTLTAAR